MASRKKSGTKTSAFGTSARVNHDSSNFYAAKMFQAFLAKKSNAEPTQEFPAELLDTTILGSAENMGKIPSNSVHLMITSPPYNVSKEYDEDLSMSEYLGMLHKVFSETHRVLVSGGRACINIANVGRKPYLPWSDYISTMMLNDIGFIMRGEIIWVKAAGAGNSCAWGSWLSASNPTLRDLHEYILVFSKGGYKRERTKTEKETKRDSMSKEDFMKWTQSVWTFNPESARRVGHPAPFPVELPRRLINLYSFETDIVLDPFMGSGTTAVAAQQCKRHWVGFETSEEYINLIKKRVAQSKERAAQGDLLCETSASTASKPAAKPKKPAKPSKKRAAKARKKAARKQKPKR